MLKILIITKKTGSAGKHAVVLRHTIEQINRHKKEMNTFYVIYIGIMKFR